MTRRLLLLCLTAAAFTMLPAQQAAAQPTALRDDIQVRNMLSLDKGIFRIVKDRRDNTLYTLAGNGSISRIERPENAVGETIAQGRVNPNTGERNWTILNSAEGLPTEMPIEAIRAAAAASGPALEDAWRRFYLSHQAQGACGGVGCSDLCRGRRLGADLKQMIQQFSPDNHS